jgi:hypothetical protein
MEVVGKASRDMDFESLYRSFHFSGKAKSFLVCLNNVDVFKSVHEMVGDRHIHK